MAAASSVRKTRRAASVLTAAQRKCLNDFIDSIIVRRRLNRLQSRQARSTLQRIAEYILGLILHSDGTCSITFAKLSAATGRNEKRIEKWIPELTGDREVTCGPGPVYRGALFIRVGPTEYISRMPQTYSLTPEAAQALGAHFAHKGADLPSAQVRATQ